MSRKRYKFKSNILKVDERAEMYLNISFPIRNKIIVMGIFKKIYCNVLTKKPNPFFYPSYKKSDLRPEVPLVLN